MSNFERYCHTTELILNGDPDTVFPLFGPIREKEWAAEWKPVLIYSESPLGDHAGTVFTVAHENGHNAIWYVNRFDSAQHEVEYLCVMSQELIKVVQVRCESYQDSRTRAFVTYTYTALTSEGNQAITHLRYHHLSMVAEWAGLINACL